MTTPNHGSLRVVRGAVLAASTLSVTVAGHVMASGGLPDVGVALALAMVMAAGCVAIADRRRSPGQIAAIVLVSQPALHILMSVAGHGSALAPNGSMVAAHVIAGLLVTALLSQGEAVVWVWQALSELLVPVAALAALLRLRPLHRQLTIRHEVVRLALPRWSQFQSHTPRRGPPVEAVA